MEKLALTTSGCPLVIQCKNFRIVHFIVPRERDCHDIYNSLLQLSRPGRIAVCFEALFYQKNQYTLGFYPISIKHEASTSLWNLFFQSATHGFHKHYVNTQRKQDSVWVRENVKFQVIAMMLVNIRFQLFHFQWRFMKLVIGWIRLESNIGISLRLIQVQSFLAYILSPFYLVSQNVTLYVFDSSYILNGCLHELCIRLIITKTFVLLH